MTGGTLLRKIVSTHVVYEHLGAHATVGTHLQEWFSELPTTSLAREDAYAVNTNLT